MKKYFLPFIFASLFLGASLTSSAQCKKFTKTECLPHLKPYIYNGQLNSAILSEGDVAELLLTFHKGEKYRIYVCNQEQLGEVQFKVFDTKKNLLFDKSKHTKQAYWDFMSNATQQLIIQITVPESVPRHDVLRNGCVTILMGFLDD